MPRTSCNTQRGEVLRLSARNEREGPGEGPSARGDGLGMFYPGYDRCPISIWCVADGELTGTNPSAW